MKRLITTMTVALTAMTAVQAQETVDKMTIYYKDGTSIQVNVESIKDIIFSSTPYAAPTVDEALQLLKGQWVFSEDTDVSGLSEWTGGDRLYCEYGDESSTLFFRMSPTIENLPYSLYAGQYFSFSFLPGLSEAVPDAEDPTRGTLSSDQSYSDLTETSVTVTDAGGTTAQLNRVVLPVSYRSWPIEPTTTEEAKNLLKGFWTVYFGENSGGTLLPWQANATYLIGDDFVYAISQVKEDCTISPYCYYAGQYVKFEEFNGGLLPNADNPSNGTLISGIPYYDLNIERCLFFSEDPDKGFTLIRDKNLKEYQIVEIMTADKAREIVKGYWSSYDFSGSSDPVFGNQRFYMVEDDRTLVCGYVPEDCTTSPYSKYPGKYVVLEVLDEGANSISPEDDARKGTFLGKHYYDLQKLSFKWGDEENPGQMIWCFKYQEGIDTFFEPYFMEEE